jgi:hypothetical protein
MHWHGASPQSGMQQMYIIPNTEKGIVKWLQPVTNEEYNNTNKVKKLFERGKEIDL